MGVDCSKVEEEEKQEELDMMHLQPVPRLERQRSSLLNSVQYKLTNSKQEESASLSTPGESEHCIIASPSSSGILSKPPFGLNHLFKMLPDQAKGIIYAFIIDEISNIKSVSPWFFLDVSMFSEKLCKGIKKSFEKAFEAHMQIDDVFLSFSRYRVSESGPISTRVLLNIHAGVKNEKLINK